MKIFIDEMDEWLHETFGNNLIKYNTDTFVSMKRNDMSKYYSISNEDARWQIYGDSIYFKNKEDVVLFKLYWG